MFGGIILWYHLRLWHIHHTPTQFLKDFFVTSDQPEISPGSVGSMASTRPSLHLNHIVLEFFERKRRKVKVEEKLKVKVSLHNKHLRHATALVNDRASSGSRQRRHLHLGWKKTLLNNLNPPEVPAILQKFLSLLGCQEAGGKLVKIKRWKWKRWKIKRWNLLT